MRELNLNELDKFTNKDIVLKSMGVILEPPTSDEVVAMTTEERRQLYSLMEAFKDFIGDKVSDITKGLNKLIQPDEWDSSVVVGNYEVAFSMKDKVSRKVGDKNTSPLEVKQKYNMADSLFDTKVNSKNLDEAIKNQIPEVMDAIRDGLIVVTTSKTKDIEVKTLNK